MTRFSINFQKQKIKKNPFGLVGEGASSSVKEGKKIKGGSHDLCCVEYIYGRRETERSLNKE